MIKYSPSTASSRSYELPQVVNNTRTYFVFALGNDRFLVSKRDHGVIYADYSLTPPRYSFLTLDSASIPAKGTNYSAYWIESHGPDTVLISTTNGLAYILRSTLDNDRVCRFIPVLRHKREGKTEFIVNATRSRYPDGAEVFTPTARYIIRGGAADSVEAGDFPAISDSIYPLGDGKIRIGNGGPIEIGISYGSGSRAASLNGTLYYVNQLGLLQSMDIRALQTNGSMSYYRFDFAATGKDKIYFANSGGLFSTTVDTSPCFLREMPSEYVLTEAIVHDNMIYGINDSLLYKIDPDGKGCPAKADGFKAAKGDRLTCIASAGDKLYIGSRNGIYAYDMTSRATTELAVENEKYQNPYFTAITYPFAGTLNQGLFFMENDSAKKMGDLNDVRQLSYSDVSGILACRTNENVSVFRHRGTTLEHIADINAPSDILAAAVKNDTLYILTHGEMSAYVAAGDSLTAVSATQIDKFYSDFELLNGIPVLYSDYSIAQGTPLRPRFTDWKKMTIASWGVALAGLAASCLIITFLGKTIRERRQELKNIQENISHYANVEIAERLLSSEAYRTFVSRKIPSGKRGQLHRDIAGMISVVGDSMDKPEELATNLDALHATCKKITEGGHKLSENLALQKKMIAENKVLEGCSKKQKTAATEFLDKLIAMFPKTGFPQNDPAEAALGNVLLYEHVYEYIADIFERPRLAEKFADALAFQKENQSRIKETDFTALDNLDACLEELRGYFGVLSPQGKKLTVLYNITSQSAYFYNWDALILLTLLGSEYKKEIRQYLKWRYTIAEAGTEKEMKRVDNAQGSFFNRNDGPGALYFREGTTEDACEHAIPSKPLDLVLVAIMKEFFQHK